MIEEIILSVPGAEPVLEGRRSADRIDDVDDVECAVDTGSEDEIARSYSEMVQQRDRFGFTRKSRQRRQDTFETAYRSLVKQIATEATRGIRDRSSKLRARTQIYKSVMALVQSSARDQKTKAKRTRRLFRWSLAVAGTGVFGLATGLIAGGWLATFLP